MTWFRVDDALPEHAKVDRLEAVTGGGYPYAAARLVWLDLGCDCSARLTDGAFDTARALRVVRLPKAVVLRALENLAAAGLIVSRGENLWAFHDWLDYQPSRSSVLAQRDAAKERQRESRAKRTPSQRDKAVTHSAVTPSVTAPRPDPTRPDPTKGEYPVAVSLEADGAEGGPQSAEDVPCGPAAIVDAAEVEAALHTATAGALRLAAAPSTQSAAIVRHLRAAGVTRAELAFVTAALRDPGAIWDWAKGVKVTAGWLAGKPHPGTHEHDCARLQEVVAHARALHAKAARDEATRAAREAAYSAPITPTDTSGAAAFLARLAARKAEAAAAQTPIPYHPTTEAP